MALLVFEKRGLVFVGSVDSDLGGIGVMGVRDGLSYSK